MGYFRMHVFFWAVPFAYVVKVEEHFALLVASSLQIAHATTQNVGVQLLLLDPVAGGDADVEHGHSRANRFVKVGPSETKNAFIIMFFSINYTLFKNIAYTAGVKGLWCELIYNSKVVLKKCFTYR